MRALRWVILVMASSAQAAGPDASQWYKSLMVPGTNASCCDVSDCRPAKATFDGDRWWVLTPTGRLVVPPDAILETESLDGISAYACIFGGRVRCFVRPGSGG